MKEVLLKNSPEHCKGILIFKTTHFINLFYIFVSTTYIFMLIKFVVAVHRLKFIINNLL